MGQASRYPQRSILALVADEWDAHGQRDFGFRMSTPAMLPHVTIDITTIGRGRGLPSLPAVEAEYDRTEVPRRVWDKYSPPDFGNLGNFEINGPGIWRGSYNSGKESSINNLYFDTECGINRASIRSTFHPGQVTLTARREGLKSATLKITSIAAPISGGIAKSFPARYPVEPPSRPAVDHVALADQIAKRNAPQVDRDVGPNDKLFAMFAYTGDGEGGQEDKLCPGTLAYTDDALLYLSAVPNSLNGARLIRTANLDRNYWANDYIVATAARDLEFFVAHDEKALRPKWLRGFKPNGDAVEVNGRKLTLFAQRLMQGDQIRIAGNLDQGQKAAQALNLILFARPIRLSVDSSRP